ncbi:hypothetical protein IEM_00800 [Bacillus cereus BAG6O-2]|nr:hypothetical protein IEM_00800 [Bacillus cereus BAG6O-2]
MGKDEIANLLDNMLDKELEDLDSPSDNDGGNWRKNLVVNFLKNLNALLN